MQKDINYAVLFGFYGAMLTPRQAQAIERYYLYDNSLGEIAQELKITRQSVRDAILKGERTLTELDEKLGFRALTYRVLEKLGELNGLVEGEAESKIAEIRALLEE